MQRVTVYGTDHYAAAIDYRNVAELLTTLTLIAADNDRDRYVRILARCETALQFADFDYAADAASLIAARVNSDRSRLTIAADTRNSMLAALTSADVNGMVMIRSAYRETRAALFAALAATADRTAAIRAAMRPWSAAAASLIAIDVAFSSDVAYIADQLAAADTGIAALIAELQFVASSVLR